ncbi:LysR substrate-binding domain-containing protein [Acinetobacter pullicarnis]|uniref:LysR substrate-binding domain-containing protein n=1 Tax=Acinetobacter pullicarnis TaxID=2576829 RepID=UPI001122A9B6|nr:LysR substrate-binding domain-containing protein [Acinetobacter pullicarnis]
MQKMTSRTYPSTTSLRCFEASARFLSFTKAAYVLHMTQSAVSKQVAHLEISLKTQLFERALQGLKLTPSGELFFKEAQRILGQIEQSVLNLLAHGSEAESLKIAVHPTLGARWLIPALKGFGKAYPNIHLDIQEQVCSSNLDNNKIDIAFLYGSGVWRDMTSIKLFPEQCVAVCAPDLINEPFKSLEEFRGHVLIQSQSRPRAWDEYFLLQSSTNENNFIGPRLETFYASIHAALTSCGIALIPEFLVEKELNSGELIRAWPYEMQTQHSYYMTFPTSMTNTIKVNTMVEWIKQHLKRSLEDKNPLLEKSA